MLSRRVQHTDQLGLITKYGYDNLGRLTTVTSPMNHVESYTYDELGEKLTQTDANGHTTHFVYDVNGRQIEKVLPTGQEYQSTYNPDGTLAYTTDANGKTIWMQYDTSGRLIAKHDTTISGNVLYSVVYNTDGTVQSKTRGNVTTSYTYDNQGRTASVTTQNTNTGGITSSVSYTYDAAGNKHTQIAASGTLTYAYDADERLSRVTDWNSNTVSTYAYDLAGNRHTLARQNGITSTYSYDHLNRLLTLYNANATGVVSSYAYTLDADGKRTIVQDQTGAVTNYGYDNDSRLTSETSALVGNIAYSLDGVGNRLSKSVNGSIVQSFIYDADDRVTNYNGNTTAYSYDSNGNVLSDGTNKYVFDWDNELTSSGPASGGTTATYAYNADGLRVELVTPTTTTNYTIDPDAGFGDVIEERDGSGNLQARYDYGDDLIRMDRSSGAYYYIFDGLGSTRQLIDGNGTTQNSYSYDAFGNLASSTVNVPNTYLFNAQCQDSTGLYYLRARYMDPTRGEFEGQDPFIGDNDAPITLHRYLYASDDPSDRVDPGGCADDSLAGEVSAMQVGAVLISAFVIVGTFEVLEKSHYLSLVMSADSGSIDERPNNKPASVEREIEDQEDWNDSNTDPNKTYLRERTLRDDKNDKLTDDDTGEGRRVDGAIIVGIGTGAYVDELREVKSKSQVDTLETKNQTDKTRRIIEKNIGNVGIRDPRTGQWAPLKPGFSMDDDYKIIGK